MGISRPSGNQALELGRHTSHPVREESALGAKHPTTSGDTGALPAPERDSALSVSESDVRQAVLSFPAGSSGGPDGLRPQHLKDLVLCRESGCALWLCRLIVWLLITFAVTVFSVFWLFQLHATVVKHYNAFCVKLTANSDTKQNNISKSTFPVCVSEHFHI